MKSTIMEKINKGEAYLPIEDYGIIGNLQTAALVSKFASIDYMCFPRFDSPTVFCKMLDTQKGGSFSIIPSMKNVVAKQLYLLDTNVLVTRFFSDEGIAEVTDYMPADFTEGNCTIVRKITTIRGKIEYEVCCAPRFDYAKADHTVEKKEDSYWFVPQNKSQSALFLLSKSDLEKKDKDVVSHFILNEAESTYFVFGEINSEHNKGNSAETIYNNTYHSTIEYWQTWISQCVYNGYWQEVIRRSALTLKLLFSHKFGSIVAAPSFSFPEAIGQGRNWDYRYTWIRDAAFSMYAFLELGFTEEAGRFLEWVKKRSSENKLQLMFAIDGSTDLDEKCLDYLEGYKCSKPVRIGNDARKQTQMDIYGELIETIYVFAKHGGDITYDYWKIIEGYIELVIKNWQQPDRSIWEVRGPKREFIFSKIMCWVALDKAIKIADMFSFPYDFGKWHNMRDKIYKYVYENYWNDKKKAFVQYKGSDNIDASAMLMPILKMISPMSERWQQTMQSIEKELKSDVLIYRYREQESEIDGLKGKEGTFCMCSFWYIQCLALAGKIEEASEHFEKMLGYANHLGLYAEELSMKGEALGNFPQAFTHLALINAALELDKKRNSVTHMRNYSKRFN
ncbi:MAG: glycoside hydrolase family 15 protein [Ilyomonas sp.]